MGTLKLATRWKIKEIDGERSIQLFDANANPLEGREAYWDGNFYCSCRQITSLLGAPSVVVGWFDCSYNRLTSLKGGPGVVGEGFYCRNNHLTSLQGGPSAIGGYFICRNTQLTSLQGAPIENDPNINEKLLEAFLNER